MRMSIRRKILAALLLPAAIAISGCAKSEIASTTPGSGQSAAADVGAHQTAPAAQSDPVETSRQLIEALDRKVQLISSVHDVDSARAVAGEFPTADRLHRRLDEHLRNALLSDSDREKLQQEFGTKRAELERSWNDEYARVVFIPGAWEHMHPELAAFADMTVYPDDSAGLENGVVNLLQKAIELQRQVTSVETARQLSAKYRASTARIGILLGRLNKARGATGGKEAHSTAVQQLRRDFDFERKRINSLQGAGRALQGEEDAAPVVARVDKASGQSPLVAELRSGDVVRARNALNQMTGIEPPPPWKSEVLPDVLRLLEYDQVRDSAAEVLKKGWFDSSQVTLVLDTADKQQDMGVLERLYEGVSRIPNVDRASIERLASLFLVSTGRTVELLRTVGPAAEPVAQLYAGHEKKDVRIGVCEVLRDIGSQASTEVLKKLEQDPDKGVADKAREALREIAKPANERPHLRNR
jgi:hypothetical protein